MEEIKKIHENRKKYKLKVLEPRNNDVSNICKYFKDEITLSEYFAPKEKKEKIIRRSIVGWQFRDSTPMDGEEAYLELEPDSKFDPNAIKIMSSSMEHIGYIMRNDCEYVKSFMDAIKTARVKKVFPLNNNKGFYDIIFYI